MKASWRRIEHRRLTRGTPTRLMGGGCRPSPPLLASSPLHSFLSSPLIFQSHFPSCIRLPSHLRIWGARSFPFPVPHLSSLAAGSIGLLICTRHENNPTHSLFLPFMHSPSFRSLVPPFFGHGAHPRPRLAPPPSDPPSPPQLLERDSLLPPPLAFPFPVSSFNAPCT